MEEQANMPASTEPNTEHISVLPTKDLFIDMLVRDITINEAVLDLVDNSIDGARRIKGTQSFEGFWIRITADEDEFTIADNCGGIPRTEAERAFRFGTDERESTDDPRATRDRKLGLIGRYGIGMKRAIFKLGRQFAVETYDGEAHYVVGENVENWRKDNSAKGWNFPLKELPPPAVGSGDQQVVRGTTVRVTALLEGVRELFNLSNFITSLGKDIARRHESSLNDGLRIYLNGTSLNYLAVQLVTSEQIRTAYEKLTLTSPSGAIVNVEIFAGLGTEGSTTEAGWYIYGNGRLILAADKSIITGWGERVGVKIPQYHYQFSRFRGYVLFESDDAAGIPWDTTKTGINTDSPIYQTVRQRMLILMRDVINSLNELKNENEGFGRNGPLALTIKKAKATALSAIAKEPQRFEVSVPVAAESSPKLRRIAYFRSEELIEQIKRCLGDKSPREIGEATFDYYLEEECNE